MHNAKDTIHNAHIHSPLHGAGPPYTFPRGQHWWLAFETLFVQMTLRVTSFRLCPVPLPAVDDAYPVRLDRPPLAKGRPTCDVLDFIVRDPTFSYSAVRVRGSATKPTHRLPASSTSPRQRLRQPSVGTPRCRAGRVLPTATKTIGGLRPIAAVSRPPTQCGTSVRFAPVVVRNALVLPRP